MIRKPTSQQIIAALDEIIIALEAGAPLPVSDAIKTAFYCFDPEALADDPDIEPVDLARILDTLTAEDLPTFQRAREAISTREQAWLGFKIVTDPAVICDSVDTAVVGIAGEGQGSADVLPGVFFTTEDRQIVFGREYSPRDRKQMLDITRGPHMHNNQYAGVAWTSIDLEPQGRVVMFGAGNVSSHLETIAQLVGFETIVIDYDENYINELRFPHSTRMVVPSFDEIDGLEIGFDDYLCILTRGHMHDPEVLAYAVDTSAGYIGMMGNPMKNEHVYDLLVERGIDRSLFAKDRFFAPIGVRFGGKTPPELAMSIAAQLVQVRNDRRKKP